MKRTIIFLALLSAITAFTSKKVTKTWCVCTYANLDQARAGLNDAVAAKKQSYIVDEESERIFSNTIDATGAVEICATFTYH